MPNLSHPTLSQDDRDSRIERYMAATRATDSLVQDEGEPGWEEKWNSSSPDYSNVTKIGLRYIDNINATHKVLNETKVLTLMGEGNTDNGTNSTWWKFPPDSTDCGNISQAKWERENASRALGLSGYGLSEYSYNLCMILHPVSTNLSSFDSKPLENYTLNMTKITTVSVVDRYVYIKNASTGQYQTAYDNDTVYRLSMWVW